MVFVLVASRLHEGCYFQAGCIRYAGVAFPKLLANKKSQVRAASSMLNTGPDFPFASELAFTLKHGWLEQESWLPDDSSLSARKLPYREAK